jgi:hypothetical protein
MKNRKIRVLILLGMVELGGLLTSTLYAADAVKPGAFYADPPTLNCLGFRWETSGDANDNAAASIRYRVVGSQKWKKGLDLWRLNGQPVVGYGKDEYIPEPMFAGSLFDLTPGTEYEVEVTVTDPDGVNGEKSKTVQVTTRKPAQAPPPRGNPASRRSSARCRRRR